MAIDQQPPLDRSTFSTFTHPRRFVSVTVTPLLDFSNVMFLAVDDVGDAWAADAMNYLYESVEELVWRRLPSLPPQEL